ncbi:hypothetical protein HBB16_01900 [Pseudonocardia sp. MCCB 268]|nr:hypothetical protein [Pseudonocardia cytotoxica]
MTKAAARPAPTCSAWRSRVLDRIGEGDLSTDSVGGRRRRDGRRAPGRVGGGLRRVAAGPRRRRRGPPRVRLYVEATTIPMNGLTARPRSTCWGCRPVTPWR